MGDGTADVLDSGGTLNFNPPKQVNLSCDQLIYYPKWEKHFGA